MKTNSLSITQFLGYILSSLPGWLAEYLTLSKITKVGKWYHENGIQKFPIGTKIKLKARNIFGYGVDPSGIVKGYTKTGDYSIEMTREGNADFFDWMKSGKITASSKKATSIQTHFKWNIENQFKRA